MNALNKTKTAIDRVLAALGTLTLAIMSVLVCYQVFARYLFNRPSAITESLSQYLFVWLIMFGSAYVYGSCEHLTIDLLKDKFSPKTAMIVDIITNISLFVFIALICVWGGWLYTAKQAVQIDPSLHISKGVLYASVPFTGIITLFYAVYNCFLAVEKYRKGIRPSDDTPTGTV